MANIQQIEEKPLRVGAIIFPGFAALDIFGALDPLNMLAIERPLTLALIAESLDPVSTSCPPDVFPVVGVENPPISTNFSQSIVPTHTFSNAPPLDLLIVPGGIGTWLTESTQNVVDFVKQVYPSLTYLLAICTGAAFAARAGVLDNKRATITKSAYKMFTPQYPKVKWVSHARWVEDGKNWTTSGLSAGLDATLAWIQHVYGKDMADKLAVAMEFKRIEDSTFDEFAALYGLDDEK